MNNITYINAGAGSGKTTKLTEILSDILSKRDVRPSEVILTTFTELAASEFREKSREKLYKDGHADIANELDSAVIGTVHAVALSFIQKYWYLIGVSPDMKVMSEDDLQVYISESMGDYVQAEDLRFFSDYCTYFDLKDGNRRDADFWKSHLLAIIDKCNNYAVDIEKSIVESHKVVDDIFTKKVVLNRSLLEEFANIFTTEAAHYNDNPKSKALPIIEGLKKRIVSYATLLKLYKELTAARPAIGIGNRNQLKTLFTETKYDTLVNNLDDTLLSSAGEDSPGGMMKRMISSLFGIASRWKDGFNDFKKRRHIIDYNDMERLFLELLSRDEVQQEIKGSYKLMMVDEFQDSSPIQLDIFKKLSDMMKISYWVGDPKQSIYGFRGADVSLVNDLTKQFEDKQLQESNHLTPDRLPNSWRSREPLVKLVNACFTRAFNGIISKDNIELIPQRSEYPELSYPLAHWHCKAPNQEAFIEKVADRVKQLIDSDTQIQIKNKEEFRKIQPGDIAILCRRNDECASFAKALIRRGVPVTFVNDEIMQQTEVQLMLTLLRFMVDTTNKHVRADLLRLIDDVPTIAILQMRLDYFTTVSNEKDKETETQEEYRDNWLDESNDTIQRLISFRNRIKNLSVSDMVDSIVYGLALPDAVAKWGNAEGRRQNLQTVCSLARQYDEHCLQMGIGASIGGFITYMSYSKVETKIDNSSNAVKILTYHKSKGLEWNYVILHSLDHNSLNQDDFCNKNFWGVHELRMINPDDTYSYFVQFLPRIRATTSTNLPKPIVDKCVELDNYKLFEAKECNELRHLLYVGMTRARDYLTTMSMQAGRVTPTLHWVRNTGISDGNIGDNAVNLWKYDALKPVFEDISDTLEYIVGGEDKYTQYVYPNVVKGNAEPKYLSPSKLPKTEIAPEQLEILSDLGCRIKPYNTKTETEAAAGTCVHNIFAVYDSHRSHEDNVGMATNIRNGNNMYEVIPNPEAVINSIEHLYSWLKNTYGKSSAVKHEVPFIYPLPGQVVHGEIDLLWMLNDKECILIDFKNFPGDKASIMNPENKHYAGNYASQLKAYRDVLVKSGITVKDTLIYYSVMGCVIKLKILKSLRNEQYE